MSEKNDVIFTGRPTDIDLLAADCAFAFILGGDDFDEDSARIARFLSRCRGPALTWAARYMDGHPGLVADSYAQFITLVKETFGYDTNQSAAIARAQLSRLRHTGTVVEFFADFDNACGTADIQADEPKLTMLMDKLKPAYRNAIIGQGVIPTNYQRTRRALLNMGAMELQAAAVPQTQDRKAHRKGKLGKGDREQRSTPHVKVEPKN